jgi:hypothetical protein
LVDRASLEVSLRCHGRQAKKLERGEALETEWKVGYRLKR